MSQILSLNNGGGTGNGIKTLTTDDANVVSPDGVGNVNLVGAHGINTSGAVANTATVAINNAITLGDLSNLTAGNNALTIASGDVQFTATNGVGNLNMAATTSTGDAGVLQFNSIDYMHTGGPTVVDPCIFVGAGAGNFTSTASHSIGIGCSAGSSLTTGTGTLIGCLAGQDLQDGVGNVAVGYTAMNANVSGDSNISIGSQNMFQATSPDGNIGIGFHNLIQNNGAGNIAIGTSRLVGGIIYGPLNFTTDGNYNIAIGGAVIADSNSGAGTGYTGSESSNICLGPKTVGDVGESNTMRLGTSGSGNGQVNRCFLAGTYNVTPSGIGIELVVMDSDGQTGTITNNVVSTFNTDSGSATPSSGSLTIAGGTNANTSGAGSTVTVNVDTSMTGIVEIEGQNNGQCAFLPSGDTGTLVIQGVDTLGPTTTDFITVTNALGSTTCNLDDSVTKAGQYIYRAGGTDVPVADGGTGASSLTDHGVLVGSGTAAVTALTVGTNGQVLLGATGADPAFATLTSTGSTITFTPGANTLNLESVSPPETCSFKAYLGTTDNNVTGNGTLFTLGSGNALTELYDLGSDFVTTGTFTAPADGIYFFSAAVIITGCTAATSCLLRIAASTGEQVNNNFYRAAGAQNFGLNCSGPIQLSSGNTVTFIVQVSGEAADTADINGTGTYNTWVSGYRLT